MGLRDTANGHKGESVAKYPKCDHATAGCVFAAMKLGHK